MTTDDVAGRLLDIFIYPQRRQPAQAVETAQAVVDRGLEGDHRRAGKRQVTLLSIEAWRETMGELGADLPPQARRANLVVEGVDLASTVGRRIQVGDVVIEVEGETDPCDLMELQHKGLRDALEPSMRGGVFGRIVTGGSLRPGLDVTVA